MLVAISVKSLFKVAGTHRVLFANVRKIAGGRHLESACYLISPLNCNVPEQALTPATADRETSFDNPSSLAL